MSDKKFEGFIRKMVDDNEKQYCTEIRAKYGDAVVDRSNAKVRDMSKEQYAEVEALSAEFNRMLKSAVESGNPAGELAQKVCELHRKWLCYFWDTYSKEAHLGVTQMYVDDARFRAYYEKIVAGGAVFLRDAVAVYCKLVQ